MNDGYHQVTVGEVKTGASIPDPLFRAADRADRRLRISRSELYARALERFLRAESSEEVTARLDAIYGAEESRLEPECARAQERALRRAR